MSAAPHAGNAAGGQEEVSVKRTLVKAAATKLIKWHMREFLVEDKAATLLCEGNLAFRSDISAHKTYAEILVLIGRFTHQRECLVGILSDLGVLEDDGARLKCADILWITVRMCLPFNPPPKSRGR